MTEFIRSRSGCFRWSLTLAAILSLCFLCGEARSASAPPDVYEIAPWFDSFSTTTLNVLTLTQSQFHTIDRLDDIDWGICQNDPTTATLPSYELIFDPLVLPTNTVLEVDIYENGPENPPNITEQIPWFRIPPVSVIWPGNGIDPVYFSIRRAAGPIDPPITYTIQFAQFTGTDNGIAILSSNNSIILQWGSGGLAPPGLRLNGAIAAQGFNVLRSLTENPGNYIQINPSIIPVPANPGPCPGSGCVSYTDGPVPPLCSGVVYFYDIELVLESGQKQLWAGPAAGATLPMAGANCNEGAILGTTIPPELPTNLNVGVGITVRNLGPTTWSAAGNYYLQVESDDCSLFASSTIRFPVSERILPTQSYQFITQIHTPSMERTCNVRLRMSQGGNGFGEMLNLMVRVAAPPNAAAAWEFYR